MAWIVLLSLSIVLGIDAFHFQSFSPMVVEGVTAIALFVSATGEICYQTTKHSK